MEDTILAAIIASRDRDNINNNRQENMKDRKDNRKKRNTVMKRREDSH